MRDPDHCTNPLGGYRIAYPDNWYSNAAVANPLNPAAEGIAACQYFAPRDFAVVYGTEPSPDIAIHLALVELPDGVAWDYGPYDGYDVLKDEPARIAGHPARVQVLELLYPDSGYVAVGGRVAQYIVALGKNRYLVGRTTNSTDYRASRRGLADMLRTLVLISH